MQFGMVARIYEHIMAADDEIILEVMNLLFRRLAERSNKPLESEIKQISPSVEERFYKDLHAAEVEIFHEVLGFFISRRDEKPKGALEKMRRLGWHIAK